MKEGPAICELVKVSRQSVETVRRVRRLLLLLEVRPESMPVEDWADCVKWVSAQCRLMLLSAATNIDFDLSEVESIAKFSVVLDDEDLSELAVADDDPREGNTGVQLTDPRSKSIPFWDDTLDSATSFDLT